METINMVNVVIADDHPLIRVGIRNLLEKSPMINVVGEARDGQEAIELVEQYSPQVLILDLQMPILDGYEVLDILHEEKNELIILILSANNDKGVVKEVMSKGAWGYYMKEEAPEQIVEAVQQAFYGKGKGHHPE